MVEVLAYVGGSSKNPYFATTSSNPLAQAAAQGTLQVGPTTNYGPAVVISYGGNSATLAPSSYSALGAGGGVITAEQAYLQANGDVAWQVSSGRLQTGLQHYLLFGASEGRFYAGVAGQSFTADQLYLEENPDVANAVRAGNFRSGLEHYLTYGARDGRFYAGVSQGPYRDVYVPTVQATQNGTTVNLTPDQQYLLSNPAASPRRLPRGAIPMGCATFLTKAIRPGTIRTSRAGRCPGKMARPNAPI